MVGATDTPFGSYALGCFENNYRIIEVHPHSKKPIGTNWQKRRMDMSEVLQKATNGAASNSVGILTGVSEVPGLAVCVLDVDVTAKDLARSYLEIIRRWTAPSVPVRIGAAPKFCALICVEGDSVLTKLSSGVYVDETGSKHKVELLARGQQCVAYGMHPDTGKPYQWLNDFGPHKCKVEGLPILSVEQVRELLKEFDALAEAKGLQPEAYAKAEDRPAIDPDRWLERIKRPVEITDDAVADMLTHVDDADDYEKWIQVGMALHHQYNGGTIGLSLWDEWSARSNKYDVHVVNQKWNTFKHDTLNRNIRTLASYIQEAKTNGWVWEKVVDDVAIPTNRFDPSQARFSLELLHAPPPPLPFIVENYLPQQVAAFIAPGGMGKTTLLLQESIHLILGRDMYGKKVTQPGPVLIVTAEDDRRVFHHRLYYMLRELQDQFELDDGDIANALSGLFIEDFSDTGCRLVAMDKHGNLAQTKRVERLIEAYGPLNPSMVVLDPMVSFGPGERLVNDAEQSLIQAARKISGELECAVRLVHHTGQAVARGGIVDQYAGRGGSALGDGVRAHHQLVRVDAVAEEWPMPATVPAGALEQGRVYQVWTNKQSWAERSREPIWLERVEHHFRFHPYGEGELMPPEDRAEFELGNDVETVLDHVREGLTLDPPQRYTLSQLHRDYQTVIGLSRDRIIAAVHAATVAGVLRESDLPRNEWVGGRRTFLEIIDRR